MVLTIKSKGILDIFINLKDISEDMLKLRGILDIIPIHIKWHFIIICYIKKNTNNMCLLQWLSIN